VVRSASTHSPAATQALMALLQSCLCDGFAPSPSLVPSCSGAREAICHRWAAAAEFVRSAAEVASSAVVPTDHAVAVGTAESESDSAGMGGGGTGGQRRAKRRGEWDVTSAYAQETRRRATADVLRHGLDCLHAVGGDQLADILAKERVPVLLFDAFLEWLVSDYGVEYVTSRPPSS